MLCSSQDPKNNKRFFNHSGWGTASQKKSELAPLLGNTMESGRNKVIKKSEPHQMTDLALQFSTSLITSNSLAA
jgi:hypothetical protein